MSDGRHRHQSHPEVVRRLRRAAGHLQGVVEMIDSGRPCLDIAQRLHAVEAAVANAKRALIHDHLDHRLDHAVGAVPRAERGPIDESKAITKCL